MTEPKKGDEKNYVFNPNDEYLFYPGPLSRQSSFDTLFQPKTTVVDIKAKPLNNPNVRKQLSKLKPKYPWFLGTISVLQVSALIFSMWLNYKQTGTWIQTDPFNYMIGPSSGVMIGARFIPCMKTGTGYDAPNVYFECPAGIKGTAKGGKCYLSDVCNFNGLNAGKPDQWYRFFSAILLHGGWLHLLFNLSFQVQGGFDLEKDMGWWRMALIYVISGVGGFVFGASMSDIRSPTVGASGSLYGMIACLFLDLFQNWTIIKNPWLEFAKMFVNIVISLLIGTLPYVDNLAHVGGFLFGILSGLLIMPRIYFGKWDRRRKLFLSILALPGLVVLFVIFAKSFYDGNNICKFCKYFNCIPGMPWCDQKFDVTTKVNITNSNLLLHGF